MPPIESSLFPAGFDLPGYWIAPLLKELSWLRHGVTHRQAGTSSIPFDSLNLGLHVGDDSVAVIENRRRIVTSATPFRPDRVVCAAQVHGGGVAVVGPEDAGRGLHDPADALPGVDALVTNHPDLLLMLFFADCVPLLFTDPQKRVIAVAHAGWRGLVENVIGNTIATMQEIFGCVPQEVLAAAGPCIGPCCFEVGPEVAAGFPEETIPPPTSEARPHVDLPRAAVRQLTEAGIIPSHIAVAGECTSCLPELYFSHRRDNGRTGRMAAFAGIKAAG